MQTDHLILAVRDLDAAHADFEKLGFTLTDRKAFTHDAAGLGNHLIYLAGIYIELMGNVRADQQTALSPILAQRQGLAGIAVTAGDVEAAVQHAQSLGFLSQVSEFEVHFQADGTDYDGRFRATRLMQPELKSSWVQIVEELVPYDRTPFYRPHKNTALKVTKTVFVDQGDGPAVLTQLLGQSTNTVPASWADTKQTFALLSAHQFEERYGSLPDINGVNEAIPGAIHIAVESLDEAAGVLDVNAVPFTRGNGACVVTAEHCCGSILVFEQGGHGGAHR
ncbi:MAG: VOC family protein [Pseudomonadota bacterium]